MKDFLLQRPEVREVEWDGRKYRGRGWMHRDDAAAALEKRRGEDAAKKDKEPSSQRQRRREATDRKATPQETPKARRKRVEL